ncbi:hypothetical protein [Jannaschia sp. M317]|uniref:hypothetical protein n=1 Tax=Jannaschia sp. M317 TaxID=2867011 RepID=UPI0021A8AD83|nr:hypothetical protein [Jannaschia sp. M317]
MDDEIVAMLGDWRLNRDGTQVLDFDAPHDASHGGRHGNVVTTNGQVEHPTRCAAATDCACG